MNNINNKTQKDKETYELKADIHKFNDEFNMEKSDTFTIINWIFFLACLISFRYLWQQNLLLTFIIILLKLIYNICI